MKVSKTQQYVFIIAFILFGSLLMYRGFLGDEELTHIQDKIQEKAVVQTSSKGSGRYALALRLKDSKQVIGIYLGTLEQAQKDELLSLFYLNKPYHFYVDPSVVAHGDVTLGIRKITEGSNVIYAENRKPNIYAGLFCYLLSGLWIVVMRRQRHLQNNKRRKAKTSI
jgi:hypothetical protein